MTTYVLAALTALLLFAPGAEARFIMFDTTFDDVPVGSTLGRGGARLEEPVEGPGDNHSEVVVEEAPGDHAVEILDTTDVGADHLIFALVDGREVTDGILRVSLTIQPQTLDAYRVAVRGPDLASTPFFALRLGPGGNVFWVDADDLSLNPAGVYAAGDDLALTLVFDLAAGTYDAALNGTPILVGEAHGITDRGIAHLQVGNFDDANATGALRLDDLTLDHAGGAADPLLLADFNDEPLGQVIGTGGPEHGQPIAYSGTTPTVESGPFVTPSLRIPDESSTTTTAVRFEFLGEAEVVEGDVSMSCSLWFDDLEGGILYVREQGGSSESFLTLTFTPGGAILARTAAVEGPSLAIGAYATQTPVALEFAFTASGLVHIWQDGARVLHRLPHGVVGRGIGRFIVGNEFDADFDGVLHVDDIVIGALPGNLTPVGEFSAPPAPRFALRAAPNPFNPSTSLSFVLPAGAPVRLEVVDPRGRRVRTLVDAWLPAGEHRATWTGRDDAGRPVAAGAYRAVLRVAGEVVQDGGLALLK